MCEFCGSQDCKLTKQQVIERGPILEINASDIMRLATAETPPTYSIKDVSAHYSFSALIPDEDEESPHAYKRFVFDEYNGCDGDWISHKVMNPYEFQTEIEFIVRFYWYEDKRKLDEVWDTSWITL